MIGVIGIGREGILWLDGGDGAIVFRAPFVLADISPASGGNREGFTKGMVVFPVVCVGVYDAMNFWRGLGRRWWPIVGLGEISFVSTNSHISCPV